MFLPVPWLVVKSMVFKSKGQESARGVKLKKKQGGRGTRGPMSIVESRVDPLKKGPRTKLMTSC